MCRGGPCVRPFSRNVCRGRPCVGPLSRAPMIRADTRSAPTMPRIPMPIDKTQTDTLKAKLRGQLILPGEAGYDEHRSVWNGMIDKKPGAIVRALGVADVVACVNFAREAGIRLAVKGGGHNIAGPAACDDGLV